VKRAYTWPNVRRLFDPFEAFQKMQGVSPASSADTLMTQQPSPTFGVNDRPFQSFVIKILNSAGTLQVRLMTDAIDEAPPWYASQVLDGRGDNTYKNLPTLTTTAGFNGAVAGLVSGAAERLVLNTGPQPPGQPCFGIATIELATDQVVDKNVGVYSLLRNINGRNWWRPEFIITNELSGALIGITTANIPSGLNLSLRFFGFIA